MAMAAAAGCSHDNPTPSPEPPAKGGEFNEFGFTTTVPVTLCVDYGDMDGMPSNVYFEVYDTCPVEETETAYARIAGTEPLYAGYTDGQGRFEGTIELPSYIRKAYVLTPAFYARTLLEATRSGDMLTASAESGAPANAAPASTRAKEYHSTAVERDGWKTWLGSYDTTYGSIGYKGDLKVKNYGALLKAHASVFDTTKKCPEEYRSSRDLYLEKSAEVVITLLGSNTCWNSSMGYYYYKTGNKPKSLADADVVMIFPNTQDGRWSNSPWESRLYQGVERGTAVQLIYYPEIADGSKAGATTVFPADYRIGFVLATNAWTNRLRAGDKKYRAATSDGLSVNNNGVAYQTPRTAVFRYTDKKSGINSVLFSFEDHNNDENFSDVVFTMTSNPVDAVTDIPSVDVNDGKKTANVLRGIYAFEDLWPSRGDYDMNDVVVVVSVDRRSDKETGKVGLIRINWELKAAGAAHLNAFAIQLDKVRTSEVAGVETTNTTFGRGAFAGSGPESGSELAVIPLFNTSQEILGEGTYINTTKGVAIPTVKHTTTVTFAQPVDPAAVRESALNAFIVVNQKSSGTFTRETEIHMPGRKPTQFAVVSGNTFLESDPYRYFVTKGDGVKNNYMMWALCIPGEFRYPLERSDIRDVYTYFNAWAASGGREHVEWYRDEADETLLY